MGEITLVTGGCRSGKSSWAEQALASYSKKPTYIATCPILDDEMKRRVQRHRSDREKRNWNTIEEEINLADVLATIEGPVLIDCLTLWLNNLMYRAECSHILFTEESIIAPTQTLIHAMQQRPDPTILVTNEIGMGIVPDNPASRTYRDCAGRIAQAIAATADNVILLVASLPLALKGSVRPC